MRLRGIGQLSLAIAGIMVPVSALAQAGGSSVTIAPLAVGAPLLGGAGLGLLAIVLAVAAVRMLVRPQPPVVRLLGVVAIALSAATAYAALPAVVISGQDCHQVTQKSFDSVGGFVLQSQCPNPIRVVALQTNCDAAHAATTDSPAIEALDTCYVGLIIPAGGLCELPSCPC